MDYQIKFTFVSDYYSTPYDYLSRLLKFIDEYYAVILDDDHLFTTMKLEENGQTELCFGEIIPYFLDYDQIKTFVFNEYESREKLSRYVEMYVLGLIDYLKEHKGKSLVINFVHELL